MLSREDLPTLRQVHRELAEKRSNHNPFIFLATIYVYVINYKLGVYHEISALGEAWGTTIKKAVNGHLQLHYASDTERYGCTRTRDNSRSEVLKGLKQPHKCLTDRINT